MANMLPICEQTHIAPSIFEAISMSTFAVSSVNYHLQEIKKRGQETKYVLRAALLHKTGRKMAHVSLAACVSCSASLKMEQTATKKHSFLGGLLLQFYNFENMFIMTLVTGHYIIYQIYYTDT